MECKCQWAGKGTRGHAELIDTLWNVNIASKICSAIVSLGINRYIMECKFMSNYHFREKDMWINRYIMECKLRPCLG